MMHHYGFYPKHTIRPYVIHPTICTHCQIQCIMRVGYISGRQHPLIFSKYGLSGKIITDNDRVFSLVSVLKQNYACAVRF